MTLHFWSGWIWAFLRPSVPRILRGKSVHLPCWQDQKVRRREHDKKWRQTVLWSGGENCSQILSPWLRNIVDSGIGLMYWPIHHGQAAWQPYAKDDYILRSGNKNFASERKGRTYIQWQGISRHNSLQLKDCSNLCNFYVSFNYCMSEYVFCFLFSTQTNCLRKTTFCIQETY